MKNLKNKANYSIYILLFLGMTSCKGDAKNSIQDGDFKIEFLFEKDGCKMYRFKDGSKYIYWSNCDGRTEYYYYQSTGKSGYIDYEQSVTSSSHNNK